MKEFRDHAILLHEIDPCADIVLWEVREMNRLPLLTGERTEATLAVWPLKPEPACNDRVAISSAPSTSVATVAQLSDLDHVQGHGGVKDAHVSHRQPTVDYACLRVEVETVTRKPAVQRARLILECERLP